jgi:hypothetical protein
MPTTRSAERKRQTRLTFEPVSSDSLQASQLPSGVRSRAAAISYLGASPHINCAKRAADAETLGISPLKKVRSSPRNISVRKQQLLTPQVRRTVSKDDVKGMVHVSYLQTAICWIPSR